MNWFYTPELTKDDKNFILPEEESKHACKVLRLEKGDKLGLLNGKGYVFEAQVTEDNAKKCALKINSYVFEEASPIQVHIAIAPTKNMDRLEWFVEKATEIGVTEISLILTHNCERKIVKDERLHKIMVSAIKQSQRKYLPKLNPLTGLDKFLEKHPKGAVAHCYPANKMALRSTLQKSAYPILIGPEGDFTEEEIKQILQRGFDPVTLGKNRLRTETAALYACMYAKTIFE
ncbi:MAG: rRNA ((1498)-N(3))-methyltransferase [Crocinitomicaceae bacterium]|jgi:16S rRNA (uracil1498-N3)-methyltransferase|nr:rRNA ((1498)-N(3))-methyltransferase [Crocinitomicaceae bacterium]